MYNCVIESKEMHVHAIYIFLIGSSVAGVVWVYLAERYQKSQKKTWTLTESSLQTYPFKAGDIILCPASLVSLMFVKSNWGHVAMVYKCPDTNMLYVWEAAIPVQGTWWTFTNSLKSKATRLIPLYRYLSRIKKPCCVRSLNREVDTRRFQQFVALRWDQKFNFHVVVHAVNRVLMDVVSVPVVLPREGKYCAELLAETLQYLGVIQYSSDIHDYNAKKHHILPKDFSVEEETLPFCKNWSYGPEILLDF